MIRKCILGILLFAALGAVLASLGITLFTWQFWVVMGLFIANDLNERF